LLAEHEPANRAGLCPSLLLASKRTKWGLRFPEFTILDAGAPLAQVDLIV